MHRAEDGARRADAERERDNRDDREARVLQELPAGKTGVLGEPGQVVASFHTPSMASNAEMVAIPPSATTLGFEYYGTPGAGCGRGTR